MTQALGNVADYVGRTVDLLAFQGQRVSGEAKLTHALVRPGEGGELCTGIQKLVQRWLIEFLTIRGTLRYLARRGCDFVGQLRRGELRTHIDGQQAFYLSAQQIKINLRAEETATTPDDEAFGAVVLEALTIVGDTVTIRLQITSLAGQTAKAILPILVRTG